jgi:hypothetical protein
MLDDVLQIHSFQHVPYFYLPFATICILFGFTLLSVCFLLPVIYFVVVIASMC